MAQRLTSTVLLGVMLIACGGATRGVRMPDRRPSPQQMAELWVDPGTRPRDLFWGVGGEKLAPRGDVRYTLEGKDDLGFSVSYDVKSPDGVEWSAKIGAEAQTEVVLSRVLWGLGYHQPPVYYLPSWDLAAENGRSKRKAKRVFVQSSTASSGSTSTGPGRTTRSSGRGSSTASSSCC